MFAEQDGYTMDPSWIEQRPLTGSLGDIQPLSFVLVNSTEDEEVWNTMVRAWHYLGYRNTMGQRVKYLVLFRDMPIAAISFNRASLHVGVRDEWIGWSDEGRRNLLVHVVNNDRFLILPWVRIKNLASHILSLSLHQLKMDWYRLYGVRPYVVETFVDVGRYQGTCYKAANWRYVGETRGFSKVGKVFVYHGNRKGVFLYLLDRRIFKWVSQFPPRRSNPNLSRVRSWDMMLNQPDWSPELFTEVGLDEHSIAGLKVRLEQYLNAYIPCYTHVAQQKNFEMYIKGLLSDLERKSVEPIALRYQDDKAVRTLQMFLKDAPVDDQQMKQIYQSRVGPVSNDPNGMFTVDGSDFPKKGTHSAGVARQYCGRLGKVENCQAGVFIGYSGANGYGLLDAKLYLPKVWFDDIHRELWDKCDIPEDTEFRTKPQLALEMMKDAVSTQNLQFQWVGCDGAFGSDLEFRKGIPEDVWFFADIHRNQRVYRERPTWAVPERTGRRGKHPTRIVPSMKAVSVSTVVEDESVPWQKVVLMEGAKGPVNTLVKCCRVVEVLEDGRDGEELWLYIRKYEDGRIKYALSNAPFDTDIQGLHHAATLRWPIEQSFQECKGLLGMDHYETRSYIGWHRHMLLVMVAHLFVLEVRHQFVKKKILESIRSS